MKASPYLMFDGRCEEALRFYQANLGGEIAAMFPHKGTPAEEHVSPEWRDKIMHACLVAGDVVLMGSDCPPEMYEAPKGTFVSLNIQDAAEAERIYNAFVEGGTVTMPLQETFWAERFAMLTDRYGTPWMLNVEKKTA